MWRGTVNQLGNRAEFLHALRFVCICGSARTSPHNKWYAPQIFHTDRLLLNDASQFPRRPQGSFGFLQRLPRWSLRLSSNSRYSRIWSSIQRVGLRSDGTHNKTLLLSGDYLTSAQWFRNHGYLQGGKYKDLQDFLRADWENAFLGAWDANDMLTLLMTWYTGDISRISTVSESLQGNLVSVLGGITAKGLILPSKTDLYFPVRNHD